MNKVILKGRLVADPELRQTQSNIAHARFNIAIDRIAGKDGRKESDFIDCDAWRNTAEFISKYFTKGQEILVEGQIHNNNYEKKDGTKVFTYLVTVDRVEFCGAKGSNTVSDQNNSSGTDLGNLGDFEEILSDGDVPF